MSPRHLLLILDGYGIAENPEVSAIDHADKPFLDELFARYPHSTLEASGEAVGLPEGLMGNSEVGHTNLGAGRIVFQEIVRINLAIRDESLFENEALVTAALRTREAGRRLHLMGLVSDGGVHSHLRHLVALLELAQRQGLTGDDVLIHAFTDGRDTDPHGAMDYLRSVEDAAQRIGVGRLATIIGRYYAMDRDRRWERTEDAYRLLTEGVGEAFSDTQTALQHRYHDGQTDEFLRPLVRDSGPTTIEDGDSVVFFNFRADRGRQLTRAFVDEPFDGFVLPVERNVFFVTMTPFEADLPVHVAFDKQDLSTTLGQVIEDAGLTQLRAAETEKYPHVTYFFSGGREIPFEGESRILVPSPKVATYDLQPEMSARELGDLVAEAIRGEAPPNLIVLNFANADMVGHTGVFEAAVKAVEAADRSSRVVVEAALEQGYTVQVIADHGNADHMRNADGSPNTAHSTALVPHLIAREGFSGPIRHGKLGDIAPTILRLMGIGIPEIMTGDVLVDI
ncbi:2,3-bisphosphoglycerate-independent phosphoglycerate mutase [soil metagenome]